MLKKVFLALLFLLLAVLLFGCNSSKQQEKNVVRIGYFPNITHAQALVGFADGSFQKAFGENVKLEEKVFNAGPSEIEAMFAGEVDLGYIGPFPVINAYVKSGGKVLILAGATNGGSVLVSREKRIKKISDLRGRKIAVPQFGNTQDCLLRKILIDNSLKTSVDGGDISVLQVENPDIYTLFQQGNLDAALVPEPWGSRLVKEAGANIVLDWDQIWSGGNYPVAVVIVRAEFMEKNPELVKKFVETHLALTERLKKDPLKELNLMNSQIKKLTGRKLPDDVLRQSLLRVSPTVEVSSAMLASMADVAVQTGYMKSKPQLNQAIKKVN